MIHLLLDSFNWAQLINPKWYIENGGLLVLLLIIFAETGLFVGFFLPGDSLLFVAGILAKDLMLNFFNKIGLHDSVPDLVCLLLLIGMISLMGILGNMVGYWTGKKVGPAMFQWRDRLLFKKKYLYQAQEFYEKHGGVAVIAARFLPIIRTFAPIVAGIVKMDPKKFYFFNVIGSFSWVASMILSGFYLDKWLHAQFNYDIQQHLEFIVLGIVLVTTAPVIWKMVSGSGTKSPN